MEILTTTIQEITLRAYEKGVFNYLFNSHENSRDEILNLFAEWGKEFNETENKHREDINWFYYDEVDIFIDKKFTEIKLADEFVEGDYIIYEEGLYKITGFSNRGILVDEIRPRPNNNWAIIEISLSNVAKVSLAPDWGIMDCGNGHDAELVKRINDAWNKVREGFKPILCALYERDINEITDADCFRLDRWFPYVNDGKNCSDDFKRAYSRGYDMGNWTDFNKLALEDMKREWDLFAENYLMHIADDGDLETILSFLGV